MSQLAAADWSRHMGDLTVEPNKAEALADALHALAMEKVSEGVKSVEDMTIITGLVYAYKELISACNAAPVLSGCGRRGTCP
jgi:hypothetical protein